MKESSHFFSFEGSFELIQEESLQMTKIYLSDQVRGRSKTIKISQNGEKHSSPILEVTASAETMKTSENMIKGSQDFISCPGHNVLVCASIFISDAYWLNLCAPHNIVTSTRSLMLTQLMCPSSAPQFGKRMWRHESLLPAHSGPTEVSHAIAVQAQQFVTRSENTCLLIHLYCGSQLDLLGAPHSRSFSLARFFHFHLLQHHLSHILW